MKFKIITILLSLIFVCKVQFLNAQNVGLELITDLSSAYKYPDKSSESTCNFEFDTHSYADMGLITITSSSPYVLNSSGVALLTNTSSVSQITRFNFINVVPGNGSFSITASNNNNNKTLVIDYYCALYYVTSHTIIPISGTKRTVSQRYSAIIILNTYTIFYNSPILIFSNLSIIAESLGSGFYGLIIPEFNNPYYYSVTIDILLCSGLYYQISVDSIYGYLTNINSDITSYPPNNILGIFKENGIGCSPLYSFISNSDIVNNPFYYLKFGDKIYEPTVMWGIGDSYTYMGSIIDKTSNGINEHQFEIYKQEGFASLLIGNLSFTILPKKAIGFQNSIGFTVENGVPGYPMAVLISGEGPYDFQKISINYFENKQLIPFPFGFSGGNNNNYIFSICLLLPNKYFSSIININVGLIDSTINNIYGPINTQQSITLPVLQLYEIYQLYGFIYLLKLKITTNNGFSFIRINNKNYYGESIIQYSNSSGVVTTDHEIILNVINPFKKFEISDKNGNIAVYSVGDYFKVSPSLISKITPPPLFTDFNLMLLDSIKFKFNNLNVTNRRFSNTMFIKFKQQGLFDENKPFGLQLLDRVSFKPLINSSSNGEFYLNKFYYSSFNSSSGEFQIQFFIPRNTLTGIIPWVLKYSDGSSIHSSMLPLSDQLYVVCNNFDSYGPIFKQVDKILTNTTIGWSFIIEDSVNGFDFGDLEIRGVVDGSIFTFHITTLDLMKGDKYIGTYEILIQFNNTFYCFAQDYIISNVELFDIEGNRAKFSTVNQTDPIENPFISYLNDTNINRIYQNNCNTSDIIAPTLKSMVYSFDNNKNGLFLNLNFTASNERSGIRQDQFPIIYLSSQLLTVPCVSEIDRNSSNRTVVNYLILNCKMPFSFGYQEAVIFSLYGLINNGGYYSGMSSDTLNGNGFSNMLLSLPFDNSTIITGTSDITTDGGKLWIFGRGFNRYCIIRIYAIYEEFGLDQVQQNFTKRYATAIQVIDILPTTKPFTIFYQGIPSQTQSNRVIVSPIEYITEPEPTQSPNPTPEPTNSSISTSTPKTTIPPQKCLGNPECGGPNQGYCTPTTGCICYSPFVGIDCSGKVIIIPKPSTNTTNPSTEIPITGGDISGNNNAGTENILFKSLISLISLRELDINSKVVNTYTFEKWVYNEINSTTNEYQTNITVPTLSSESNDPSITHIKVMIQWFKDETNITFANQQLTMQPSSIKYTVELSSYKFKNQINTLQLVMSASLSSSKTNDICSDKEFGSTSSGDNSNYINVQVGDHSLYGRFIKRAIVDNITKTIGNELLDQSLNAVSNASSAQSFIGINLPNFKQSIVIDPDFSVLLNSNDASESNNSICTSSSKLSTSQLTGIIIGSVAFATVVVASIVYFIYKRKQTTKLHTNIQNKLKTMG